MLKLSDGKVATQLAKDSDIHVITGLLKLYLRELPESLFTDALYPSLVTGMGTVDILLTAVTIIHIHAHKNSELKNQH